MPWPFQLWVNPTSRVPDRFRWDLDRARNSVLASIDSRGFDKQVFLVAASGFLTDSYALFATNIILPSLAYIYWPDSTDNRHQLAINCVTLAGSVCGQALFGYLADKYGRRKLYGVELIIVIFGTLGMAQASTGANKSMSILWWIIFWRFFMGLGIGAEYPLSAVITAEFASTNYRAIMMACVFAMQPLGQLCAAAVGWGVLTSLVKSRGLDNIPVHGAELSQRQKFDIISTIDSVWRCVVGVGTIPALIAIIYRLSIPESPRYTMDVLNDGVGAFYDIRVHHNRRPTEEDAMREIGSEMPADLPTEGPPAPDPPADDPVPAADRSDAAGRPAGGPLAQVPAESAQPAQQQDQGDSLNHFTAEKLREYFITQGNWMWLAATSTCWFLLDFAFYGLGIDNPRRIAAIWAPSYPSNADFQSHIQNWPSDFQIGNNTTVYSNARIPDWENPFDVKTNIYQELYGNAFRYVMTISIGSLVGSLFMIVSINKLPRKGWLISSFLILAVLFMITGASLRSWEFQRSHWAAVAFYTACQFFFNFGPNTLTFIIPAEIFPTRYRCTCHGISAACGKLGSLAVQGLLSRHEFSTDPTRLRIVLGCFTIPMTLGAVFAWGWLPNLQDPPRPATRVCEIPTLPSKELETLAKGRAYATGPRDYYPPRHRLEGRLRGGEEVLTLRGKLAEIGRRVKWRWSGGFLPRSSLGEGGRGVGEDAEMVIVPRAAARHSLADANTTAINGGTRMSRSSTDMV